MFLGASFRILCDNDKYTVGRNSCNLDLTGDASISREHAAIYPSPGKLQIEDCGSKYGIYLNENMERNKRTGAGKKIDLQPGFIVRFGRLENIWRLERSEFVILTSALTDDDKQLVKGYVGILDGRILDNWNDSCTHLVMSDVVITIKVLLALVKGIPIVRPSFLNEVIAAVQEKRPDLPDAVDFVPAITEPYILKESALFAVNLDRRRLFEGKTFVFMVRRHRARYESIIQMANGTCVSLDSDKIRKSNLVRENTVVVNYVPSLESQSSQDIVNVADYVIKYNKRLVHDSEIGLAILHCSIDRFCNPDHKLETDLIPSTESMTERIVMAEDTPHDHVFAVPAVPTVVLNIPETINIDEEENQANENESKIIAEVAKPVARRATRSSLSKETVAENQVPFKELKRKNKQLSPKQSAPIKRLKSSDLFQCSDPPQEPSPVPGPSNAQALAREPSPVRKPSTLRAPASKTSSASGSTSPVWTSVSPSASNSVTSPPFQVSQTTSRNLSGFICSQKRLSRSANTSISPCKVPEPQILPGTSKKRAFEILDANSDDDDCGNLFQFEMKAPPKRQKKLPTQRAPAGRSLGENDDDDDDIATFGFGDVSLSRSNRQRNSQSQQQPSQEQQASSSSEDGTSRLQRPLAIDLKLEYIKPVPFSMDGWLQKSFAQNVKIDEENENTVKIKEEKLEEWEMTKDEKNRRWVKSISNAFEVRFCYLINMREIQGLS